MFISPDIEVRPSPGKGRGYFAKKAIAAGTKLISETPVLSFPVPPSPSSLSIYRSYENLDEATRNQISQLSWASNKAPPTYFLNLLEEIADEEGEYETNAAEACNVAAIFHNNAFGGAPNDGKSVTELYLNVSKINHSCLPNTLFHSNPKLDGGRLHALRDIEAGEEITYQYIPLVASLELRLQMLQKGWGFSCLCAACDTTTKYGEESKIRRQKMIDLLNQTLSANAIEDRLQILPPLYLEAIQLMNEDGLIDDTLGTM
jgi:hypothetical protein